LHQSAVFHLAPGDEVLLNLQKLAKGAAKKKVLRPQPKLDAVRFVSVILD
jgi:hypothetical protein